MNPTAIIKANIRVHEALLQSGEYEKSPHRSDESRSRVTTEIRALENQFKSKGRHEITHADIGCGDGFIFECTPTDWKRIGIDAAPLMLEKCKEKHPFVTTKQGVAESIPLEDSSLDIVTCYSFLDHLEDRLFFYKEAYRILKPGGLCYFGLSPNRLFAESLAANAILPTQKVYTDNDLEIEYRKAFSNGDHYLETYGITPEDLVMAEPGKSQLGGMNPAEEISLMKMVGFTDVQVKFNWIMRQNTLDASVVSTIHQMLPISASCFKYFDLYGSKI